MDVTCESCRASYRVDDAKIPPQGIKAKCPKCGHSFLLKKPAAAAPSPDAAIPVSDDGAPPPPPDPFAGGFGAAPAPGGAADPFSGGFGGAPSGFGSAPAPDLPGFGAAPAPAPDPFSGGFGNPPPDAGGVFGGGGFGAGGFDAPADGGGAGLAGMFQAKTAFEIRRGNGQVIGPFDMFHIKQMIYEQQLDGAEQLNDATGNWVPITSIDELGEIFRLTGAAGAPAAPAPEPAPARPQGGFVPHESVANAQRAPSPAPATSPVRAPAKTTTGADAPAPPVAFDTAGKRSFSERILILVEKLWALSKKPAVRAALGAVAVVLVLGALFLIFKAKIYHAFGWDTQIQAAALVAEGDRTLGSDERGPLVTAESKYRDAVAKFARGVEPHARLAEIDALLWWRDPARLDLKVEAEQNIAAAEAIAKDEPSLHRARAALALAQHDGAKAATEAQAAIAAAAPQGDAFAQALAGDAALEKGDLAAAEAAYGKAGSLAARSKTGIARVKARAGDFAAAKTAADDVLKSEPSNGVAKAISLYAATRAPGADLAAARAALREIALSSAHFAQDRSRAEFYLGLLAEEAKQPAVALGHYRAAVSLYPADAEALASAKRLFADRFKDKPVDAWVAAVAKVRGSTSMSKILDGEAQYAAHNWQGAISPLLAATTEDTSSARAQLAFGRLESAIGGEETKKAKSYFERALSLDPGYVEAAIELSRWQLENGDPAGARASGEKAIAIDPTSPEAYEAAAAAAIAGKDPAQAEQWLLTATEIDPDDYQTWMDLGDARRLAGNAKDAIDPLKKSAELKKDIAEPLIRLGNAYEDLGDLKSAGDAYLAAAKIEPNNVKVALRGGVAKVKNDELTEGKKALEAVLKDHPELAEGHFFLGVAYQNTGEPEKALDSYRQAIKREYPDAYLAHFHMGEIFEMPGSLSDRDQAREHLKAAAAAKPDFYRAHEELANVALAGNEFDEAIKELKLVEDAVAKMPPADRNPILERVRLQQGKILKNQGKTKDAEKYFNEVLKIDPKSAPAYFNLGELYRDTDSRKAKTFYQKAITANPSFASPYKPLGYMLKDDGNECQAKKLWMKFLDLSTNPDEKKEIQDEVGSLSCE